MNKRNYSRELDRIIQKQGRKRPRVLLHSCCGPCSSSVLEYLTGYFDVTLLWYNPNLYPEEEFDRRFKTQVELIEKMGLADRVNVLAESRKSGDYYSRIKGLENEPEGGRRCTECFRLRLLECARLAKHYGYDYFCTTLTVSRHKDAERINALGEEIGKAMGVAWLPSDFKKRDGENRSQELAEKFGLYRQLYCGCEFSLHHREENRPENKEENTMMNNALIEKLRQEIDSLVTAPSCCAEAKEASARFLAAIGTENEESEKAAYIKELEADRVPIEGLVAFAQSDLAVQYFGDMAGDFLAHALELQDSGAKYCDCPACAACGRILDLLK